ncbi:hypothetical protein [Pseudomonas aeruginosa]|uniref:hypothetical protein n=1 Tax=Pseudomonas aeruginosa TaxID=287 RepID=UPI003D032466
MSEFQTLQVGSLELRKTADGWQYLSEGIGNDPDRWCDATGVLGPFGNSGVNTLLDELLAARQEAEQKAERVCENCRYWGQIYEGCCDFIDTIAGERVAATTGCQIIATVSDDTGLNTVLKTGPNFSCPNFSKQR